MPQFRSRKPAREVALGGAHEKFKVWRDNGEEEEDSALLMAIMRVETYARNATYFLLRSMKSESLTSHHELRTYPSNSQWRGPDLIARLPSFRAFGSLTRGKERCPESLQRQRHHS